MASGTKASDGAGSNDKLTTSLRSSTATESGFSRAAKLGDYLSARWLVEVHHSLATYHSGADGMNKRCAMWLPIFLQGGIHFFGERTEILALNNFVLFDRVLLPMIGKRARRIYCLCERPPALGPARGRYFIVMKTLGDAGNT